MVNYGRSGGCNRCKSRKIKVSRHWQSFGLRTPGAEIKTKCDESRPMCNKCQRISKSCPGYSTKWDIALRNENQGVKAKTHLMLSRESTTNLSTFIFEDDVQLHAICLFFKDYTIEAGGICTGWLNYLPKMYQECTKTSLIYHAVSTAAYANLSRKTDRSDISIRALSHYCTSLHAVKSSLHDKLAATSDAMMTAIMLLLLYEYINGPVNENFSLKHSQGLVVLADIRGSLLMEGNGPALLQVACCQMQKRNLNLNLMPGSTDERLISLLDSSLLSDRMTINMYHVTKLVANIKAEAIPVTGKQFWDGFLYSFDAIERQCVQWEEDAMLLIAYQKRGYPDLWSTGVWNKHRATRILLHQAFLEVISPKIGVDHSNIFDSDICNRSAASCSIIQDMIKAVFDSVPFSLGETSGTNTTTSPKKVGGYFLAWTLQIITRCTFASTEQQNYARSILLRVGR